MNLDPLTRSFEDEFHRQLGRLIHETARFDFHVGLQLRRLGAECGVDVERFLVASRHPLTVRLAQLKKVVRKVFNSAGPAAKADFDEWFKSANGARALRNDYAHGRWGVPGRWAEPTDGSSWRVPILAFVKLDWDMSPDRGDLSVYMSLEDFVRQVDDATAVFYAFFGLVDRHFGIPALET